MVPIFREGPSRFPAYVRLRFLPDTPFEGQKTTVAGFAESWYEHNTESEQFAVVLEILSGYTSTPDDCYFCLWGGWGCEVIGDDIPMVKIPNRDYWLFCGALTDWDEWGPTENRNRSTAETAWGAPARVRGDDSRAKAGWPRLFDTSDNMNAIFIWHATKRNPCG